MERQFDLIQIEKSLPKKESGIKKYVSIMDILHSCDVSKDKYFQKLYKGFYRLRLPATEYYKEYFNYLEGSKSNKSLNFENVIEYISNVTGRVEASFSSKILATINPNMPVWDNNIFSNLSIKKPIGNFKDKIVQSVSIYNELCNYYKEFLNTNNAKQIIKLFDDIFPQYNSITDIKKIDLAIWSLGAKPKKSKK